MPDTIEQTTTGPGKTIIKWFSGQIDIKLVIMFLGAMIAVAFFWKDSHSNWDKTDKLEEVTQTKASQDDFKALKEQVSRQYSTQSSRDDKQDANLYDIIKWVEQQKGYQQAIKDLKK